MIDTTEAVRLAAEAGDGHYMRQHWDDYGCACGVTGTAADIRSHLADAAVTAALPALAEQFAALIEEKGLATRSLFVNPDMELSAQATFTAAARLVREAAEVTG